MVMQQSKVYNTFSSQANPMWRVRIGYRRVLRFLEDRPAVRYLLIGTVGGAIFYGYLFVVLAGF
jgi:hypothetical protein